MDTMYSMYHDPGIIIQSILRVSSFSSAGGKPEEGATEESLHVSCYGVVVADTMHISRSLPTSCRTLPPILPFSCFHHFRLSCMGHVHPLHVFGKFCKFTHGFPIMLLYIPHEKGSVMAPRRHVDLVSIIPENVDGRRTIHQ